MKAAVVTAYGEAPRWAEMPEPVAAGPDDVVVEVLAAALSPRVRSQAAGTHYTSGSELPLVPGIDGVGRLPDGGLVYFVLPHTAHGAMAQRVVIDARRAVPLPPDADPAAIAAVMNPAMASWVALRERAGFVEGQSLLILGATGSAGRAAVQVAHLLGAGAITAVGRRADRMHDLTPQGATALIELEADPTVVAEQLAAAGSEVDVVLDFLWGEPTRDALLAIIPRRARDEQTLTWVQIGSVAGSEAPIPGAALRAVDLRLVGSGQGSVGPRAFRDQVEILAREVVRGAVETPVRSVPLSEVETMWDAPSDGERLVFVP